MEAVVLFFVPLLLWVTGCVSPGASPAATQEAAAVPTLEAGVTSVPATPEPMTTSAQSEIPAPGLTPIAEPLSPEPQTVEFQAADGQVLHGFYYPAAVRPASLVVLMHWLPGDQHDWDEIAPWLQNRGLVGKSPNVGKQTWLDPSWFPPMVAGQPWAIFTFSFRGCEGRCKTPDRPGFLLDAQAAMQKASDLEGIDPQRIVVIGASIGADSAVDGCSWLNAQESKGRCLGALSFSPGNYLTMSYADAVAVLEAEQPPKPVWCLFSKGDQPSAAACTSASGEYYRQIAYDGNRHGMALIDPKVEPNALQLILDFLKLILGL